MDTAHQFLLQDLTVIVVAAAIATWVCSWLRMPILLGYIVVGILLSPVFGILQDSQNLVQMGELGVLFMMFFVGIEFNPDRLRRVFAPSFFGILFQIIAMAALGMFSAHMMGMNSVDGVFLGGVLAMSSTIVIVEIFGQRGDISKRYAQIAIGILIIEDLFAIFLLVMLSSMGNENPAASSDMAAEIIRRCLALSTFVVTIYVVGKMLAPALLKRFALSNNPQVLIMFAFSIIMGLAALAIKANLSLALGAFLAGSIISGTLVSDRIETLTSSFRNLFVALFFVSVGTMIKPEQMLEMWLPIVLISLGVILFQTLACFFGIVIGGASARDAYQAAINKAQIGEFSFVIAGLGITLGVMNPAILSITMGVSFLSVLLNPLASSHSETVMGFFSKYTPRPIKAFFDAYSASIRTLSESSKKKTYLRMLGRPLMRIAVYAFLFNAILVIGMLASGYFASKSFFNEFYYFGIWGVAALFSLPIVAGIVGNIDEAVKTAVASAVKNRTEHVRAGSAGILHAVFSTLAVCAFALLFFGAMQYHFPKGEAFIFYTVVIVVFTLIFWRFLFKASVNMQFAFVSIFHRHLRNAEHYRHEMMVDKIRRNYSWITDLSEVSITDTAKCAGLSVRELSIRSRSGAEIVAIKRGRFAIYNVLPDTRIFPDDIVVLSGGTAAVTAATEILTVQETDADVGNVSPADADLNIECLEIPAKSPIAGKTLAQANIAKLYFVKILGISTSGSRVPRRPSASDIIGAGNKIFVMGDADNVERFRKTCALRRI